MNKDQIEKCQHNWTSDKYEGLESRVCNACGQYEINALLEKAVRQRDYLTSILVKLFGWSDESYLHAVMHVENAVNNLQSSLSTVTACNEAMREPMRKLRELMNMWSESETSVVNAVVEEVTKSRVKLENVTSIKNVLLGKTALALINEALGIQGAFTVRGDEVKCWTQAGDEPGVTKTYLDSKDCYELAECFETLGAALQAGKETTSNNQSGCPDAGYIAGHQFDGTSGYCRCGAAPEGKL